MTMLTYSILALCILVALLLILTLMHLRLSTNYRALYNTAAMLEDERDLAVDQRDHVKQQFEEQRTAFHLYRQGVATKGQADVRVQELTKANLELGERVEDLEEYATAVEAVLIDHIDGASLMRRVQSLLDEWRET